MDGRQIRGYAQFAADITSHAIAPTYTWVMYDPEYWPATPLPEQQNPATYMQLAGALARQSSAEVGPARPPGPSR